LQVVGSLAETLYSTWLKMTLYQQCV